MSSKRHSQLDLTVKGETIERIYSNYQEDRYIVNRRYQRKLVWSLEEKESFIDSIASNFPVPIILLADPKTKDKDQVEIIDGMQRMNAVVSFIENEFSLGGLYFDLNSMAVTKALLDDGILIQKEPMLERSASVQIASYNLPLSIFESAEREHIEEVFRRINSGGKKLSNQELRIAGATGTFASSVRHISSLIRGDSSNTDHVPLNKMKEISITSKLLDYGIDVEQLFWVKNGVLAKDQLRESRDEEIVADMMAYMLSDVPPPSRGEFLDVLFGFKTTGNSQEVYLEYDNKLKRYGPEVLAEHFQKVYDELKLTLEEGGKTLKEVIFEERSPVGAPRYFQVVFLSMFEQIVKKNKIVSDRKKLLALLRGTGDAIVITEGGSWGAQKRAREVKKNAAVIEDAFEDSKAADPARAHWVNQLENILTQSKTEQAAYDFKQGFLNLGATQVFDEDSFERNMENVVGISNLGHGRKGYIIIGVADKPADAKRVQDIFSVKPRLYKDFRIIGIEHEAKHLGLSIDQYFQKITSKIGSSLNGPLKTAVMSKIKLVNYYDKTVLVIEIDGQKDPSNMKGRFFVREASGLKTIEPERFVEFMNSYPR